MTDAKAMGHILKSTQMPHQGLRVAPGKNLDGPTVFISTDWHPSAGSDKYMIGTFLSPEDAEDLAIVLLYTAKEARELSDGD